MAKKKPNSENPQSDKPRVHKDLEGFDIQINSFGEIVTSFEIDKINQFLNKTVDDKKLRHRKDLDELKGERSGDEFDEEEEKDDDDRLDLSADLDEDDERF